MEKGNSIQQIKKDIEVTMPKQQAQQFLIDTIETTSTLQKLDPIYRNDSKGSIDTLSVQSRRLRKHSKNHTPNNTTDGIDNGQIEYNVQKVFWDTWLNDDDVWYNLRVRGENIEDTVIGMIQRQFGVDLQDLIFNGDTEIDPTAEDAAFLSILDGFVKKMKKSPYVTDLGDEEPTLLDFINHVQILPERYKNAHDDITWFMTRNTHDKLMSQATQRMTGFGDAVLQDGKLVRIAGYQIEIVATLQSGFAALTPMKNLKPVFTRDLRYNRTGVGATAVAKDATYHILFAYLDAVLREVDAVAYLTGSKL
ncbi:phage major capsid protein [Halalkalibacterium halodurans]|uniref:phage major capsid protein n=1 Tax=Halalkalibacterium halodurans TaxID=86665 RepID=UPI00106846AC|nr:phage major capsid protein [Halalkalibacterium halodurans]TES56180.1 phage major capsid protein [Halalkalibacterium halodurans]